MKPAAAVPTIEVREYSVEQVIEMEMDYPFAVIVRRRTYPAFVVHASRHRDGAEAIASELRGALADAFMAGRLEATGEVTRDAAALDQLNRLLSAAEWPGASGMEDVCEIVRATGRVEIADAPEWEAH